MDKMKTLWLVENLLHDDEFYDRFRKACSDQGIEHKEVDFIPTDGQRKIKKIISENPDKLIIPYGCIEYLKWYCRDICKEFPNVTSGAFFDLKRLAFEYHSSYWGKYLLNQRSVITTYAELIRRKDFFYEILGEANTIFVRPNSNDKVFTGKVIYKEEFEKSMKYMGHSIAVDMDPHLMVVVAAPKNVVKEWRFIISNKKVITSSLYNVNGLHDEKAGCDNDKANELAQEISQHSWQPDDIYALDLCETKGGEIAMLEIGSMNSAGWYAMDCDKIISAVEEWKNNYEKQV